MNKRELMACYICRKFKIVNNNEDVETNITNVFGIIRGSVEPGKILSIF